MRLAIWLGLVCALGCGAPPPAVVARAEAADETPSEAAPAPTRKQGVDWPRFLGPTGDSISPEKGILSPWPAEGLRVVWQIPLGTGYGAPTISRGRLYLFDRRGNQARL